MIPLLHKLSKVRIFPRVTIHTKKLTRNRTFDLPYTPPRERGSLCSQRREHAKKKTLPQRYFVWKDSTTCNLSLPNAYERHITSQRKPSPTTLVHQPPFMHPCLTSTTNLQYASLSVAYRHNHLPNNARLKVSKFWMPKPPPCLDKQILVHFTKWNLGSSFSPPHRKSHCSFSNLFATLTEE